jgi:hypothetical protein
LFLLLPNSPLIPALQKLLQETALRWITTYDDYSSEPVRLSMIQLQRYPEGGIGMNVEFQRGTDPIQVSLLMEHPPGQSVVYHNQKRAIAGTRVQQIDADMEAIMRAADELALAANRQRTIYYKV